MKIWRSISASADAQHRAFRHNTRTARVTSTLTAAAIAALLVLGTGVAYGEDNGSGDATTLSDPAPADATSTDVPADPPAEETPAEEPATEAPATEEPSTEEPATDAPDGDGSSESTDESTTEAAPTSETSSSQPFKTSLAELVSTPIINALTIACAAGSPEVGGFEIDGDTCVETGLDWDTTGDSVFDDFDDDGDWFTGGSSKDDHDPSDWLIGGNAQTKTDIETAWAWAHVSGDVYSYFAFSRHPESFPGAGGDVNYDIEYNQLDNVGDKPSRSAGDLLLMVHQGGGTDLELEHVYEYTLGDSNDCAPVVGESPIEVTNSNPAGVWCPMDPGPSLTSAVNSEGSFAEGALNISALYGPGNCSGNFGVVNIRSRSSNSPTSTLADQVDGIPADIPSTCGKIIILKKDQSGDPLGGATFSVSPNPDPSANNADPYSITDNDSNDQNPADGIIEISPVDPGSSYTVTETGAPPGYTIDNPLGDGSNPNPQTVNESDTKTYSFTDTKIGDPLTLSVEANPGLTRTYPWSIAKSTTTPKVYVKDGQATADYTVTVTAGEGVDSGFGIIGTVTVNNPNNWAAASVTSLPITYTGGGTCAVTGESFPVDVAASGSHNFAFSCDFVAPDPSSLTGTVNATVNWDPADINTVADSATDGDDIVDADWAATSVNDSVVVHDDNATPGDTGDDKTWNLDWATVYGQLNHQEVITYSVDVTGDDLPDIGTCDNRVNTVKVVGDNAIELDADSNAANNSATVEICNPYTQIQALKVDFETGEPVAGAEFTLYEGPTDQGTVLGTAISDANGIAVFANKLLPGTYTVKETAAPPGYDLPIGNEGTVTITIDHILDPDSNFVENGVMAPITFRDPAQGQLQVLSKQHLERDPATNDWVPSDGAVDFGNEIRYVVNVKATGPKLFHEVTLTDYVPGFNPLDTTSTADGVLEAGSATCSGDFTCTATEDLATGLITWKLTTAGQQPGVVRGDAEGSVEFVVRMPDLPVDPPFVDGVFSSLLWNQAYLDWDEAVFTLPPTLLAKAVAQALILPMEHHMLASNEVTDEARAFEPAPPVVDPPVPGSTPLPNTGGPYLWVLLLGMGLALGGTALVLSDRRYRRRS